MGESELSPLRSKHETEQKIFSLQAQYPKETAQPQSRLSLN